MPKKATQLFLVLHDTNARDVLYGHYCASNKGDIELIITDEDETNSEPVTRPSKENKTMVFSDVNKEQIRYYINMIDSIHDDVVPRFTNAPCWWCRSPFKSNSVACPIRYCRDLSPDDEGIDALNYKRIQEKLKQANLPSDTNDFFETEGLFCSFPCVKAYIIDQLSRTKSGKYKRALTLLTFMYQKLMNPDNVAVIPSAPHWKMLSDYGGHLTVDEFRLIHGNYEYEETVNVKRPYMYTCSSYFQERRVKA